MANILNNKRPQTVGDPAALETPNYISQIKAGDITYDIATHHGITFKNGMTDTTGTVWNGITDLEVIIPTVTDLVKTPIQFAGTVGKDGSITYNEGVSATPEAGYLVFITADCSFNKVACEAGDMAVYDGAEWKVVTGENQVEIVGVSQDTNEANVVLTATAKDVLTVEGKTLKLSVDYTGVKDVLTISKNGDVKLTAADGTTTVAAKYIKLTKADDETKTIGKTESANIPTALESGVVTINEKVLVNDDINFNAGVLPTLKKNDAAVDATVNSTLSIGKQNVADGTDGVYVTSIDGAIKSASLVASDTAAGAALTFVKSISAKEGAEFVNGIHVATSTDENKGNGDFVIPGKASLNADKKTFVTGLGAEGDTGALVSKITVGAVTVGEGTDIVTGLDETKQDASGDVITNVTVGTAVQDATAQWFYSGFGEAKTTDFDVVSSVSVGAVSLVADDTNTFANDVLATAKVDNHVLSFGTVKASSPVKVDQKTSTVNGKSFTKSGVKLSGFAVASANLTKGGISQAESVIKYKNIVTGDAELTYADDVKYYFDKAKGSSAFEATTGYAKLDTVNATINKNTPILTGGVTASIPTDKVVVDFDISGTLPSLTVGDASGSLSGSVGTALSTVEKTWIGLEKADIDVAGAYTLNESAEESEGAIEVAKAGTYDLDGAHCDITADTFVTDVTVKKNA